MGIFDEFAYKEVHPVFLYESIINLIIFAILRIFQSKRKFRGQILYSYLALYSGARMFLEGLRIDSLMFFRVRISKLLSIIVFLCSIYILSKKMIKDNIKIFNNIKQK